MVFLLATSSPQQRPAEHQVQPRAEQQSCTLNHALPKPSVLEPLLPSKRLRSAQEPVEHA